MTIDLVFSACPLCRQQKGVKRNDKSCGFVFYSPRKLKGLNRIDKMGYSHIY
jgi:hypothetical protein